VNHIDIVKVVVEEVKGVIQIVPIKVVLVAVLTTVDPDPEAEIILEVQVGAALPGMLLVYLKFLLLNYLQQSLKERLKKCSKNLEILKKLI
jgi:hypothetical protein